MKAVLPIVTASRCIINGKAVLMGFDAQGKELFGIGVRTKSVVRWAMEGVSKADLKRLKKQYAEWRNEIEWAKCPEFKRGRHGQVSRSVHRRRSLVLNG